MGSGAPSALPGHLFKWGTSLGDLGNESCANGAKVHEGLLQQRLHFGKSCLEVILFIETPPPKRIIFNALCRGASVIKIIFFGGFA